MKSHIKLSEILEARFHQYVRQGEPDECWLHTKGTVGFSGYGQMSVGDVDGVKRKLMYLHRIALILTKGDARADKPYACHTCDNSRCCNPAHLYWGSAHDNAVDKQIRGANPVNKAYVSERAQRGSAEHKQKTSQQRKAMNADPKAHTAPAQTATKADDRHNDLFSW